MYKLEEEIQEDKAKDETSTRIREEIGEEKTRMKEIWRGHEGDRSGMRR